MRPTVIIRSCRDYDTDRIRTIVREGLEHLDLRPHGKALVKPNVVAAGERFPHAYTRPEFTEGVLRALRDRSDSTLDELAVGERCGITMPTRYAFREADYYKMVRRVGNVKLYHFDETPQVEIPLYHEGRLRDSFFTPQPVAEADFFVNCPKFKAHPWTTVTFSMKNYIGIQDDRHRLIDHDHKLNAKVADLQYITQPKFIAIDAITAGEGRMLTPIPFDLGLVIMGNNQVAVDSACCQMIGLDPLSVEHIRLAHERGFGPVDMERIDFAGDVTLEEARTRGADFRTGLIRVEDYFKDTKIRAYAGPAPDDEDYCWGGCPGAIQEAIEILRQYDDHADENMRPLHVVFGAYDGPIDAGPKEPIIFIGDCATYHGKVGDREIHFDSVYEDRSKNDPRTARHSDIYAKMHATGRKMKELRAKKVIRLEGCPVSVAEQVLALVYAGGLQNPYLDPSTAIKFSSCYLSWRTRSALNRLVGRPYQVNGPTHRGDSRPVQNLPPSVGHHPLEAGKT